MNWSSFGRGLQQAAGAVPLYTQLKQQALQNALAEQRDEEERANRATLTQIQQAQLGLQQDAAADHQKQQGFDNAFKTWQNLPVGSEYNPSMNWPEELRAAATYKHSPVDLRPAPVPDALRALIGGGSTTTESISPEKEMIRPSETAAARASTENANIRAAASMRAAALRANAQAEANAIRVQIANLEQAGMDRRSNKQLAAMYDRLEQALSIAQADNELGWAKYGLDVYEANNPKPGASFNFMLGGAGNPTGGAAAPPPTRPKYTPPPRTGVKTGNPADPEGLGEYLPKR